MESSKTNPKTNAENALLWGFQANIKLWNQACHMLKCLRVVFPVHGEVHPSPDLNPRLIKKGTHGQVVLSLSLVPLGICIQGLCRPTLWI